MRKNTAKPLDSASRRLNIRIDEETYMMLVELRTLLRSSSDSACIRTLIRLEHAVESQAIEQLRQADSLRGTHGSRR